MNLLMLHLACCGWKHQPNNADRDNHFLHYCSAMYDGVVWGWDAYSFDYSRKNKFPPLNTRSLYPNKKLDLTWEQVSWT